MRKILEYALYATMCVSLVIGGYALGLLHTTPEPLAEINITPRISIEQIHLYEGLVCIDLPKEIIVASFTPSGSMLPGINSRCLGIQIVPESDNDIFLNDIIAYRRADESIIVHRVIEKRLVNNTIFYFLKGDNNLARDPYAIDLSKIVGVNIITIC